MSTYSSSFGKYEINLVFDPRNPHKAAPFCGPG